MNPIPYMTFTTSSTALSYFIFMVRKHKVHPTTMYVEIVPQISSTHSTTFNMPAGSSRTPWTFPKGLSFFSSLHKYTLIKNHRSKGTKSKQQLLRNFDATSDILRIEFLKSTTLTTAACYMQAADLLKHAYYKKISMLFACFRSEHLKVKWGNREH